MSKNRPIPDRSSEAPPGASKRERRTTAPTGGSSDLDAGAPPPAIGKRLLEVTRPFAVEDPLRSWWSVISTIAVLSATLAAAALAPWWPIRLAASLVGGLLLVRSFILYHDFMHGALLRRSRLARPFFTGIGLVLLSPARYWRHSHNFHHGNVGKPLVPGAQESLLLTSDLGSFPLMTTDSWRKASAWQHLRYRLMRHPATLLLAYVTVFLVGLTLLPFVRQPRRYWDGAISVLAHGAVVAALWVLAGFQVLLFAFLLPFAVAAAMGAYLFYAQHNYDEMRVLKPEEWTYYRGALESSSYMRLGRLMDWFTGNIGYHHVHHMNPLIPFYRLPEAMRAVPELQRAGRTSLRLRDIAACLRLNLWDPGRGRLVTFGEARQAA